MEKDIGEACSYLKAKAEILYARLYHLTHNESQLDDTEYVTGIFERLEKQSRAIESALHKIENGTYGICESCGREINHRRLQALPESTLCIACKANLEKNNRSDRKLSQPISISDRYQDYEVCDDQYS